MRTKTALVDTQIAPADSARCAEASSASSVPSLGRRAAGIELQGALQVARGYGVQPKWRGLAVQSHPLSR